MKRAIPSATTQVVSYESGCKPPLASEATKSALAAAAVVAAVVVVAMPMPASDHDGRAGRPGLPDRKTWARKKNGAVQRTNIEETTRMSKLSCIHVVKAEGS